jgi:hypothetical protein
MPAGVTYVLLRAALGAGSRSSVVTVAVARSGRICTARTVSRMPPSASSDSYSLSQPLDPCWREITAGSTRPPGRHSRSTFPLLNARATAARERATRCGLVVADAVGVGVVVLPPAFAVPVAEVDWPPVDRALPKSVPTTTTTTTSASSALAGRGIARLRAERDAQRELP